MHKLLDKSTISTGQPIEAWEISQSIDAFTGVDDYTIKISGSLDTTGSVDIDGNLTASGDISSSGTMYANVFNGMISSSDQISADISGSLSTTAIAALGGGYYSSSLQVLGDVTSSGTIFTSGTVSGSSFTFGDGTVQTTAGGSGGAGNQISQLNSSVEVTDGGGGTGLILFRTSNIEKWQMVDSGDLLPLTDNAHDIGSPSEKVKTIYATSFSGSASNLSGSVSINNSTPVVRSLKTLVGSASLTALGNVIINSFSAELSGKTLGVDIFITTGIIDTSYVPNTALIFSFDSPSGEITFLEGNGVAGSPTMQFTYQIMYY